MSSENHTRWYSSLVESGWYSCRTIRIVLKSKFTKFRRYADTVLLADIKLRTFEMLAFLWIFTVGYFFCILPNKPRLALSAKIKQKYQKGNIEKKGNSSNIKRRRVDTFFDTSTSSNLVKVSHTNLKMMDPKIYSLLVS